MIKKQFLLRVLVPMILLFFTGWHMHAYQEKTYVVNSDSIRYFKDSTKALSFQEVLKRSDRFTSKIEEIDVQSVYWRKFNLPHHSGFKYIVLQTPANYGYAYIPYKSGYKRFYIGYLTPRKIKHTINETTNLQLPLDSLDTTHPIYYSQNHRMPYTGKVALYPVYYLFTNNENYIETYYSNENAHFYHALYSAVLLFSAMFFILSYYITKDKNFINYTLYLLADVLIIAQILPFFSNYLRSIDPSAPVVIMIVAHLGASYLYLYFSIVLINLNSKIPRLYKQVMHYLKWASIATLGYIILVSFFPNLSYRDEMYTTLRIAFSVFSFYAMVKILQNKPNLITKIVVFGGALLFVGNLSTMLLGSIHYFFIVAVAEVFIFGSVIGIKNKQTYKKSVEYESSLHYFEKERTLFLKIDEIKKRFFSSISHEFRTPLTLINYPIERAIEDETLPEHKRKDYKIAKHYLDQLLSLVNQLLDLSKIDAKRFKMKYSLGNIIKEVQFTVDSFFWQADEKKMIYNVYLKEGGMAWFDHESVQKIVINIISNAIKYTPVGGKIAVIALLKNEHFYFRVRNQGEGILPEDLEYIFDRFYQTNENNQGTGVGLALVKELVNLHNGCIDVKSTPGEYTVFTVKLPVGEATQHETLDENKYEVVASEESERPTSIPSIDTPPSKEEVKPRFSTMPQLLIVEDNVDLQNMLIKLFENKFNVYTANDGLEGINRAIKSVPDIIISDIMMPKKNGFELTQYLKQDERTSHIPIVLLTAKAEETSEYKGLAQGADAYITKPFTAKLLQQRVYNLMEFRNKLQARYHQNFGLLSEHLAVNSVDERFLMKVQKVLENSMNDSEFNTTAFSEALGVSRMQLHRKLKALTGLTTTEFIRSQRLKQAAELLQKNSGNVSEIAYSVGFNTTSYFIKSFKAVYGCTPNEYSGHASK